MTEWQVASNVATGLLSLAVLAGLLHQRRARRSYSFTLYVAFVAMHASWLVLERAPRSWSTWLIVELLLRLMCAVVALEFAMRQLGALPRVAQGASRAIRWVLAASVVFFMLDLPTPWRPTFTFSAPAEVAAFETAQHLLPRLAYGSAWLFAALYAVAVNYGLPVDPLHRTIVIGFGSYLLLYSVTLATLPAVDLHVAIVSIIQAVAFLGLLGAWVHAAWRREKPPDAPQDVVQRVWPWSLRSG